MEVTFSGWWDWGRGLFPRELRGQQSLLLLSEQPGLPKQQTCGSGLWLIFWEMVYPKVFNQQKIFRISTGSEKPPHSPVWLQKQCCFHYSDWVLCLSLIRISTQRGTSLWLIVTIIVCSTRCFGFNIGWHSSSLWIPMWVCVCARVCANVC